MKVPCMGMLLEQLSQSALEVLISESEESQRGKEGGEMSRQDARHPTGTGWDYNKPSKRSVAFKERAKTDGPILEGITVIPLQSLNCKFIRTGTYPLYLVDIFLFHTFYLVLPKSSM